MGGLKQDSHLSFGRQVFHTVGFEEGEVNHGLEQRDGLLGVTSLPQKVALLKKEGCRQGEQRGRTLVNTQKGRERNSYRHAV